MRERLLKPVFPAGGSVRGLADAGWIIAEARGHAWLGTRGFPGKIVLNYAGILCYVTGNMTIENLVLANTLVFVMIGLVIIIALFVLGAMYAANMQVAHARKAFDGIRKQTMSRLEDLRMILAKTYTVQKKIPEIEEVLLSQLDDINARAVQANQFLEKQLHRFSAGIDAANRRMDIVLSQYSRFASQLDTWVRVPVVNIKAVCSGVSTGVHEMARKERSVSAIPNDEEFFI